jgi:hypothetical protein
MKAGKLRHGSLDLTGQIFGMLTAVRRLHSNGKHWVWLFQCRCGQQTDRVGQDVKRSVTRGQFPHCGCMKHTLQSEAKKTHGMSRHPAYAVWRSMKDRCELPSHQAWRNYGGRGITVCPRWRQSFQNFWDDMGGSYQRGLDLDRKDNNGNYRKDNCRWVARRINCMNRRATIRLADVRVLAKEHGLSPSTLYYRIKHGWRIEDLTRPPSPTNRCTTS